MWLLLPINYKHKGEWNAGWMYWLENATISQSSSNLKWPFSFITQVKEKTIMVWQIGISTFTDTQREYQYYTLITQIIWVSKDIGNFYGLDTKIKLLISKQKRSNFNSLAFSNKAFFSPFSHGVRWHRKQRWSDL